MKIRDKFGATKALRAMIESKYEIIEFIGRGSYGSVSKGKCKLSGKIVAIKIMENQTDSEYDSIKLVREIQLMRHLNKICKKIDNKANTFIPELIDIICLELPANQI